jgi:hypothetical protein
MWYCGLVVVGLMAAVPARTLAQADEPSVVIRVKSLDTVLQNLKLLASIVGREDAAQDIQGLIKAKVGAKGLQGIDLARPVGAYVRFGKAIEEINGAVLVPVADEQAFLTLLENLQLNPTKGKGGIYTLQALNIELYLRFSKNYAFITAMNTENLNDRSLLDPAKVLAGPADSVISAAMRLDQVPEAAKLLALGKIETDLSDLEDKAQPNETPAQKEFRKAIIRQVSKTIADVLKDGKQAGFDISMKANKDLAIQLSLTAQPGTELAKTLQSVGQGKSPFAGLMTKNPAFRGGVDFSFSPAVNQAFIKVVEEGAQKGLGDISNPDKKRHAQALLDAVLPTIKTGEFDAFFGMSGPVNNHFTLLAAVKTKDGDRLGGVVHDMLEKELKNMPADQRDKIKLDVDAAGGVKIHRFELPRDAKTGKLLDDLPGDPNLFVAFRKDALFLAIGPEALATLKEAVSSQQSGTVPAFLFDFNVARMAPAVAQNAEQKQLAAKLFPAGKESSIRIAVEGGQALTLRVSMALDVLEFFAKMKGKD